jgi:hypothetical protein
MSKLDVGVGDEFPLDATQNDFDNHHGGRHRHHRYGHHHHHHHGHHRHGFLHLPLFLAVAGIAALIGAGKIPATVAHAIEIVAIAAVLLAVAVHLWLHRRWHSL